MRKLKNVLIIMTDQQRKDSLGCYGNRIIQTPNIDALAKTGLRFNRRYVSDPTCMPNRLSIFTGRTPRGHGRWTNGLTVPEIDTLATAFSENNYQTASIGKIHFSPWRDRSMSWENLEVWRSGKGRGWSGPYWGFQHVELTLGHTSPLAHYGQWFFENGGRKEMLEMHPVSGAIQSGVRYLPEELHDSSFIAERACDYLRSRDKNRPFFLVASFPDPHHPFNPPKITAERYDKFDIALPKGEITGLIDRPSHYLNHYKGAWSRRGLQSPVHPHGISEVHTREIIAHTYAMIDLIDRSVGKILDTLRQDALLKDTIIVFTTDHGELLGDHGLWFKGPFYYEGLISTPMILNSPGQITPGTYDNLFSDIDFAPTLCELAGIPILEFINGFSHAAHFSDTNALARSQCLIEYRNGFAENDCSSKCIVTNRYKYVRYQTGEEELTDLYEDPQETKNVSREKAYSKIKMELRTLLLDEILKTESKAPRQNDS